VYLAARNTAKQTPAGFTEAPERPFRMAPTATATERAAVQSGGYASSHDCRVNCGLRSADRRGRRPALSGSAASGARDGQTAVARQKAGGRLCAGRADLPGPCQRHRRCVRPQIPGLSPGGLGPHLTSSGSPAGFPPVSRLPAGSLPFVRLLLVSLRPAFSGLVPSAVARFRFPFGFPPGSLPLSNLHVSAAAGRFRRRWSRAAGTKVTSPAATTPLWIARSARPADGQRLGTMGSRHRIACYERPRAQDIAAPEPPRAAVHVRHATHKATTQRDVRAASLRCTGRRRASAGKAAR
jgi:hypothetical protein